MAVTAASAKVHNPKLLNISKRELSAPSFISVDDISGEQNCPSAIADMQTPHNRPRPPEGAISDTQLFRLGMCSPNPKPEMISAGMINITLAEDMSSSPDPISRNVRAGILWVPNSGTIRWYRYDPAPADATVSAIRCPLVAGAI